MRHLEPRLVRDGVAEQDQVQIERPGSAPERADTPVLRFDLQQQVEQLSRRERGFADERGVQVERLRFQALSFRLGFDEIGEDWRREMRREPIRRERDRF